MKPHVKKVKKTKEVFKLLGENILIGPGTVPTSGASLSRTSMTQVIDLSREASKEGVFRKQENGAYGSFRDSTR